MCKEGMDIFESGCKGMNLFRDDRKVIIDKDSCFNECYKIVSRKTRVFPDKSSLVYDEILICADKNLLIEIADVVKKEFD